ncbi:hypothetical protein LCGC14_0561220 [marine sediment metagenome]|uniref:Uncharacterized protein n=1 Tax=marine sediment metagenome TaxID=412755 RepID=A0A0F9U8J0_9ZZZZ
MMRGIRPDTLEEVKDLLMKQDTIISELVLAVVGLLHDTYPLASRVDDTEATLSEFASKWRKHFEYHADKKTRTKETFELEDRV